MNVVSLLTETEVQMTLSSTGISQQLIAITMQLDGPSVSIKFINQAVTLQCEVAKNDPVKWQQFLSVSSARVVQAP